MKDFTTLELILISAAVEIAIDDPDTARFKVVYSVIDRQIELELKARGVHEYLKACDEMQRIDPDFTAFNTEIKAILTSGIRLKNLFNR